MGYTATPTPAYRSLMIFIDGGYLRKNIRDMIGNDDINFLSLTRYLSNTVEEGRIRAELVRAYYYDAIVDNSDSNHKDQQKYFDEIQKEEKLEVRLGRSLQHLIQIIQEWNNLGIDFICKTQPIDTTTNEGKLIFHIFGAIAEFERGIIRERINSGLDRARRQGKKLGRPKGSKDKKRRKKGGYYLRYQNSKQSSPSK